MGRNEVEADAENGAAEIGVDAEGKAGLEEGRADVERERGWGKMFVFDVAVVELEVDDWRLC